MERMLIPERVAEPRKKILVVDDYPPARKLIAEALTQNGDYEVTEAGDGKEALRLLGNVAHDMVISDVLMPGMSGIELLSALREINPGMPVLMITAYPALELSVAAMKKGAVDFIRKPFDIRDLKYKVDIYLQESSLLQGKGIENKQFWLQDKTRELSIQSYIFDTIEKAGGDTAQVFKKIVELAVKVVEGDSGSLFLLDGEAGEFRSQIIQCDDREAFQRDTLPVLNKLFRKVVEKKEALIVNPGDDPSVVLSLICAPLMIRGNVLGILSVRKKKNGEVFTAKDLKHILSLTKRASLSLENTALYESIYGNLMDTFKSLVASIQVRDHYTESHSHRVAGLACKIAASMNCDENDIEAMRIAGTLHDVGKISIPDHILLKPKKLTSREYEVVKQHPTVGDGILKSIILFDNERVIVQHHHERWDGSGYPDKLAGTNIPYLARILAVADSFDAMTSNRPYRNAMKIDEAVAELQRHRGISFDGEIVDCFVDTLKIS